MQSSRLIGAIALVEAVATMLFAVNPLFCQPPAPATLRQSQSEEINYLTFTLAHRTLTPQTVTVKQEIGRAHV